MSSCHTSATYKVCQERDLEQWLIDAHSSHTPTPARLSRSIDMPLHPPARQPPGSHHPYSRQHCQYSARIICIYHISYLLFLFLTTIHPKTIKENGRPHSCRQPCPSSCSPPHLRLLHFPPRHFLQLGQNFQV